MYIAPPNSKQELMQRAHQLTGLTLQQIAHAHQQTVPTQLVHAKGWVGMLLEHALGANANSLPQPDFAHLGIELKTIPLNQHGTPKESTYVCMLSLSPDINHGWQQSLVYQKLKCVLWITVESDTNIPISQRRIGTPLLWQPSPAQAQVLQQDWEEIIEITRLGELDQLNASIGCYLHVRPKAANAKALTTYHSNQQSTLPRGFYLRSSFTQQLLITC